jgi:cyclic pyranopterin phosphate synthase
MKDRFSRKIDYLRISVTDRCNLRCRYCMPESGLNLLRHEDILSFEEILEVVHAAADIGITKVRLTGGEPLVRHGIIKLVRMIAAVEGIKDFAMTTNGILLPEFAFELARAGLHRVNISLDTAHPERFRRLTRGGDIRSVFEGIEAAKMAGLSPIKLNCVKGEFSTESDIRSVKKFGHKNGLSVRFIRLMDFKTGSFSIVEAGSGGDCPRCNRIRLSSDGLVRPCLFSDISFSVRKIGMEKAIRNAIAQKPEAGGPCTHNWMHSIGG